MNKFDVAIIGAGIVGAACAYRLSKEGLRVAIIEEEFAASGTTAAGMGHIVVMDDSEAQFALTKFSQDLWFELSSRLPADNEFENCGTIWIAADDAEMKEAERKHEFYRARGVASTILNPESLYKLEPNLRWGLSGGLLVGSDSVVYQLCATRHFIKTAIDSGATVLRYGGVSLGQ